MGVDARIVVYAKDQTTAEDACAAAFARIADLDTCMSDYRKTSELNMLCDKAGGPAVPVSEDLFKVLSKSLEFSRLSSGAFDITVSPLVRLWRAARKTGVVPAQKDIDAAKALVSWKYVHLDKATRSVRLDKKGMKLDLGGIAKGLADEEAQKVLRSYGITSALIEMGGDIVVTDAPPQTDGWSIDVPNDVPHKGVMKLKNCAISSSGDTVQFVVIGDKKFSHVVDPHTGYALTQGVQATVITQNGTDSDALSTTVTLLNASQRKKLLRHFPGTRAYVRQLKYSAGSSS